MTNSPELNVAIEAAKKGAEIALSHFDTFHKLDISLKPDTSIVTKADIETQSAIKDVVLQTFPSAQFIAEEDKIHDKKSGETWIIDPIDGTKEFSRGIASWSVLVAFARDGQIIAGVAYFPVTKKLYYAQKGRGAFLNEDRLTVSDIGDSKRAFLSYSPIGYAKEDERRALLSIADNFGSTRSTVASFAASLVSEGKMDGYIATRHNRIWDNAPFAIIVPEAGGMVTDWDGSQIDVYGHQSPVVMSNGVLHEQIIASLVA